MLRFKKGDENGLTSFKGKRNMAAGMGISAGRFVLFRNGKFNGNLYANKRKEIIFLDECTHTFLLFYRPKVLGGERIRIMKRTRQIIAWILTVAIMSMSLGVIPASALNRQLWDGYPCWDKCGYNRW